MLVSVGAVAVVVAVAAEPLLSGALAFSPEDFPAPGSFSVECSLSFAEYLGSSPGRPGGDQRDRDPLHGLARGSGCGWQPGRDRW